MADTNSSIFNESARTRLQSPDDLDRYIRVTSPGVWVAFAAVIALLIGLLAWGVFGSVSTSVSGTGTYINGEIYGFLTADDAAKVHVGNQAYVDGGVTVVDEVSEVPLSREEAQALLQSDYLVDTLMDDEKWAYVVTFDKTIQPHEGVPLTVSITTDRIAPISLVLGS